MRKQTKNKTVLLSMLMGAAVLYSCSDNSIQPAVQGMARLSLDVNVDAAFTTPTRSLNENDYKNLANYTVEVRNAKNEIVNIDGTVLSYNGNNLPTTSLEVPVGTYSVVAYYGQEMVSSRNVFRCEGSSSLNLKENESQSVQVNCTPTCGKVKVAFSDEMVEYFDNYYVTFKTPKMESNTVVTWDKNDYEPWYLAVGQAGDVVQATIHLTVKDGKKAEGTIERTYNLMRNKAWTLNIAPNYNSSSGSLGISIEVDDSTNDHEVDIVIPSEWV